MTRTGADLQRFRAVDDIGWFAECFTLLKHHARQEINSLVSNSLTSNQKVLTSVCSDSTLSVSSVADVLKKIEGKKEGRKLN